MNQEQCEAVMGLAERLEGRYITLKSVPSDLTPEQVEHVHKLAYELANIAVEELEW